MDYLCLYISGAVQFSFLLSSWKSNHHLNIAEGVTLFSFANYSTYIVKIFGLNLALTFPIWHYNNNLPKTLYGYIYFPLFPNIDLFSHIFYRSSHRRCSVKKGVPKNFTKLTGKKRCWSLFFNKVAGLSGHQVLKG